MTNINNNIVKTKLNDNLNNYLQKYFAYTNLIRILRNDCFIAGGFARIVGHCEFLQESNDYRKINKYLEEGNGDIDIFSNSLENIENSIMLFTKGQRYSDIKEVFGRNTECFKFMFKSPFSKVFNIPTLKAFKSSKRRSYSDSYIPHFYQVDPRNTIKFQFVNKFFHESPEESFKSFDFTNCMYALTYENSRFYITYDKSAVDLDRKKALNLQHAKSPFLGCRIIKYIRHKGVDRILNSEGNKKILDNFLLKVLTNDWCDVYKDNVSYDLNPEVLNVSYLHDTINLEKEQLVLFLGQIKIERVNHSFGSYGVYRRERSTYDWALSELSNSI